MLETVKKYVKSNPKKVAGAVVAATSSPVWLMPLIEFLISLI